MKTKLNKCWKLIGGGTVLLVSSLFPTHITNYFNTKTLKKSNTNKRLSDKENILHDVNTTNDEYLTAAQVFGESSKWSGNLYYYTLELDVPRIFFTSGSGATSLISTVDSNLVFPSSIKIGETNYVVTGISDYAFDRMNTNADIQGKLTLPDTLWDLNTFAFFEQDITSLVLPFKDSEETGDFHGFGEYAFSDCKNLSSIDFSECTTKNLGTNNTSVFDGDPLTEIITPASWDQAGGNYLTKKFTNQVGTVVGKIVCAADSTTYKPILSGLAYGEITLDDQVTSLPDSWLVACDGITNVDLSQCNQLTTIPWGCFDHCTNLKNVVFPKTLETIKTYSFGSCTSLKSINLSSLTLLTKIVGDAFYGCTNVTSINLSQLTTPPSWDSGVFSPFSNNAQYLIPYTTDNDELQEWINAIGTWHGSNPQYIGFDEDGTDYASGITSGNIKVLLDDISSVSSSLKLIDGTEIEATDLSIYDNVNIKSIDANAFKNNTHIFGTLTLPNCITNIGAGAFTGCSNITSVNLTDYASKPSFTAGCFNGCVADFVVPYSTDKTQLGNWYSGIDSWTGGTANAYINDCASYWAENIISGNFKVQINDNTGTSLTLVNGADVSANNLILKDNTNIDTIDDKAFENNNLLKGLIKIPANITTIGANVFNGCSNVNEIDLNWTNLSFTNALNINKDWLGDLNNPNTTIRVPAGMIDDYQAIAVNLGIDQCNITDATSPSESTLNLGIALGVSLGICIGIPGLIGLGFIGKYKTQKSNK